MQRYNFGNKYIVYTRAKVKFFVLKLKKRVKTIVIKLFHDNIFVISNSENRIIRYFIPIL